MKTSTRPVGRWDLPLTLDETRADSPLFLNIARALSDEMRRGRLPRGALLPGSRELARQLGVHRNTVLAAYRELLSEGWIETTIGKGTFVSVALPDPEPRRFGRRRKAAESRRSRTTPSSSAAGFDLCGEPPPSLGFDAPRDGNFYLYGGVPDLRLVPASALSRAYRRALRPPCAVLGYGDPRGHVSLREVLAPLLARTRGLSIGPDDLVVTRGSQMALALSARAILQPGDVVAVEAWGYRPAWEALRGAGAKLVPVPVDDRGLCVQALSELARRQRIRAVYVTPHHQYPTTVPLAPERRLALLALATEQRFAIFEDDYDHEFHFEGRPLLPLASADESGVVVYIGTFSKSFAPGLRLGYVSAPRAVLERVAAYRFVLDRQGDHASECAMAELIEEGELSRHVRRTRREYLLRRDICVAELRRRFGDGLDFRVPKGGMSLWVRAHGVDTERWLSEAKARGVWFQSARQFSWDDAAGPYLRIGYACYDAKELKEALGRLHAAFLRTVSGRFRADRVEQ